MDDELSCPLSNKFEKRKLVLARYLAIVIAHEILWETNFLNEIINFFDYFKSILLVVKGEEGLVVAIS